MDEQLQPPSNPVELPQDTEESSGDQKTIVRKVIDAGSWIVLFLLLPFTVLVLLSQNSLPGSFFYPVKRGMENVILAAASLNPATSVAFRTDLTKRRFSEAQTLLLTKLDTTGLRGFVAEVYAMETQLATVRDPQEKARLQEKIDVALAQYQDQLQTVKTQIIAQNQSFAPTPPPAGGPTQQVFPTATPIVPTNTPVPVPTTRQGQRPLPTNTSVPLPTAQPIVLSTSTPAQTRTAPTATRVPYPTATPIQSGPTATSVPSPTPVPSAGGTTNPVDDIDAVQVYLQCLRDHPDNAHACQPPANLSAREQGQAGGQKRGLQEVKNDAKADQEQDENIKQQNINKENNGTGENSDKEKAENQKGAEK